MMTRQTAKSFAEELGEARTVTDCIHLYQKSASGSTDEASVIEKINRIALTFEDWDNVFDNVATDSSLASRAIERMSNLAQSFDQWGELIGQLSKDASLAPVRERCLSEMSKLAGSLSEWRSIYDEASSGQVKSLAMRNIVAAAKKENAWDDAISDLSDDDPLRDMVASERAGSLQTLEECESLYDELSADSPYLDRVLEKIATCTEPLADWVTMYDNRSDVDRLTDTLLAGMIARASTVEDWISVVESTDNVDDDRDKVREILGKISWSKEQWEAFRSDSPSDGGHEDFASLKLLQYCDDLGDTIELYITCRDEFSLDDETMDKLREAIISKATASELKILDLLSGDDDLQSLAHQKLHPDSE
jgi:hypothetical protein